MPVNVVGAGLGLLSPASGGHDGNGAHAAHVRTEGSRVASHVGQHPGGHLPHPAQQRQGRCQLMRLAGCQQEVDQPPRRIADADDLGAKTTSRSAQRLAFAGHAANESQTQSLPKALPGRAPDAF